MNDKVVYRHRRLDTNEVFYVGEGSLGRSKDRWSRSTMWKRTVKKAGGFSIEILAENLNQEDAWELEVFLIELYGRKNLKKGPLVNLTDGGKHENNRVLSKETRNKISGALRLRVITDEHRKNLSLALTGYKRSEKEIESNRIRAIEWHKNNVSGKSKKVVCTKTNNVWESATLCAKENNLSYGVLKRKLNGGRNNNTTYKYLKDE